MQFAEDMVKKASQDKITEGLRKLADGGEEFAKGVVKGVEDEINGILKDLLNSKKDE